MLVKFELLIVYNVNTLNFIWLIKGFVYTSFVVMEHISYRHLDSYFNIGNQVLYFISRYSDRVHIHGMYFN